MKKGSVLILLFITLTLTPTLRAWRPLSVAAASPAAGSPAAPRAPQPPRVHAMRVIVLSTMLADAGIGEWGFSALVEADGRRILFDTGTHPDTVLRNARELGIDLSQVKDVVLSHNHDDHTGGLVYLRRELMQKNPAALSRAHVAPGIFWSRLDEDKGHEANPMLATRPAYLGTGGVFIEHDKLSELWPGVFLTGPVPRRYPERNWSGTKQIRTPKGVLEDNLPEDQALVIDTDRGLVVVTGCGHAGIINIVDFAQQKVRQAPIYAVLGGLHLLEADDARLDWTATELKTRGLSYLLGAHCTGIEALFHLRNQIGLLRRAAVVGSVGASFTLAGGIEPGRIAR